MEQRTSLIFSGKTELACLRCYCQVEQCLSQQQLVTNGKDRGRKTTTNKQKQHTHTQSNTHTLSLSLKLAPHRGPGLCRSNDSLSARTFLTHRHARTISTHHYCPIPRRVSGTEQLQLITVFSLSLSPRFSVY